MSELANKEYHGITEFKNILSSQDIKVWIYTMSVKDLNSKHNENYQAVQTLKRLNKDNNTIVFNEHIIGAFEKINNWDELKYTSVEHRCINVNIGTERKILERLLLEEVKENIDKSLYETEKNSKFVYIKKPILKKNNLIVKRKIGFDINIEDCKNIIVGFTLSHGFEYENNLDKDLILNNISQGDKVKDYYNNSTYIFKEVAPFTISDKNDYMQCSIIDYYNEKGLSYVVSKIDVNTKAVLVETNNKQIFPYIPNRLKKVCDFGNLPGNMIKECNKYIKLKSHDRMQISIDIVKDILKNNKYIRFNKK